MAGNTETISAGNCEPLIVFLHIPKTAGTSLSHLLRQKFNSDSIARIYAPEECARPLTDHAFGITSSISCISGHIEYGIHQYLSRECEYFSMIREPVSRVLSHYHYTRSKDATTHPLGEVIEFAQNSTVLEYLRRFPAIAFEQIRILSGVDAVDRSALQMAKDNVTTDRIRVGLTEDFFQSTEMIFQQMGLGYPRFAWKRKNTGRRGSKIENEYVLDASTLSALEEICALDIELYQHTQTQHALKKKQYQGNQRTCTGKAKYELFQAYSRFLD